jgi:hypothetical protein
MEGEAEAGWQELRPLLQAVPVQFNTTCKIQTNQQCCGSGSERFWALVARLIAAAALWVRIQTSLKKQNKMG